MLKLAIQFGLAILAATAWLTTPAWAQTSADAEQNKQQGGGDLVRVGDHVVTRRELDLYVEAIYLTSELRQGLEELRPLEREEFYARSRAEALRELIGRLLVVQGARDEYLKDSRVSAALQQMVDKEEARLEARLGTRVGMYDWLREQGITLQQWRDLMTDHILYQNYLYDHATSRAAVTPAQVRDYYDANAESLRRPGCVVYRLILVDPEGCADQEAERAKAERVLARIRGGADFVEMADKYSLDRAIRPGGLREVEVPLDSPGWLPPVCIGLKAGEVSEARRSAAGYSIARLESVREDYVPSFEEAQPQVQSLLLKRRQEALKGELIAGLMKKVDVEYFPAGRRLLGPEPMAAP